MRRSALDSWYRCDWGHWCDWSNWSHWCNWSNIPCLFFPHALSSYWWSSRAWCNSCLAGNRCNHSSAMIKCSFRYLMRRSALDSWYRCDWGHWSHWCDWSNIPCLFFPHALSSYWWSSRAWCNSCLAGNRCNHSSAMIKCSFRYLMRRSALDSWYRCDWGHWCDWSNIPCLFFPHALSSLLSTSGLCKSCLAGNRCNHSSANINNRSFHWMRRSALSNFRGFRSWCDWSNNFWSCWFINKLPFACSLKVFASWFISDVHAVVCCCSCGLGNGNAMHWFCHGFVSEIKPFAWCDTISLVVSAFEIWLIFDKLKLFWGTETSIGWSELFTGWP